MVLIRWQNKAEILKIMTVDKIIVYKFSTPYNIMSPCKPILEIPLTDEQKEFYIKHYS